MAKGGPRIGAGRPKGCRDRINIELAEAVEKATGSTLEEKIVSVFEDRTLPIPLRLEALRRESTVLGLRVLVGADGR